MDGVDEAFVKKVPGLPVVLTSVEWAVNAGRSNSIWTLTFGLRCCALEMMATGAAKYDWARFGLEVPAASPRRADMMIVAGTIAKKMEPLVKRLYEQMAEPKYVIAMGSCAISGGPFIYDSYSVINGADKIIPVDIYVPGCPPRPEALLDGIIKLQKQIMKRKLTGGKI
ncbi:MAG: NADH-quinone oxidoreductase subunit B [Spirochaetia bacterium]|nr:NADH-quinone oxidoreductase subunit B [Spirochaetia bacterium]